MVRTTFDQSNPMVTIPPNYLPKGKLNESHIRKAFADELTNLDESEHAAFIAKKIPIIALHLNSLKNRVQDFVRITMTAKIIELKLTHNNKIITTVEKYKEYAKHFLKNALNVEEVVSFYKNIHFPVTIAAFDHKHLWQKEMMNKMMREHNLQFQDARHYKGNSIRNVATSQKNIPIKNFSRDLRTYTNIYINVSKTGETEETNTIRKRGEWYDYFLKWKGQDKGKTIEQAFEEARQAEWNVAGSSDGITKYKITEESIRLTRIEGNNDGWDKRLLTAYVNETTDATDDSSEIDWKEKVR